MSEINIQSNEVDKKIIPVDISDDEISHSIKQTPNIDDISENTTNFTSDLKVEQVDLESVMDQTLDEEPNLN